MTCGHLLNDRPEVAILSFEAALIFGDKLLKIMKEHPVNSFRHGLGEGPDYGIGSGRVDFCC